MTNNVQRRLVVLEILIPLKIPCKMHCFWSKYRSRDNDFDSYFYAAKKCQLDSLMVKYLVIFPFLDCIPIFRSFFAGFSVEISALFTNCLVWKHTCFTCLPLRTRPDILKETKLSSWWYEHRKMVKYYSITGYIPPLIHDDRSGSTILRNQSIPDDK